MIYIYIYIVVCWLLCKAFWLSVSQKKVVGKQTAVGHTPGPHGARADYSVVISRAGVMGKTALCPRMWCKGTPQS